MGRKTESNEQKVKKVYPHAEIIENANIDWDNGGKILDNNVFSVTTYTTTITNGKRWREISKRVDTPELAWSDALKQINAAKRKKYYKRKITRPNNEKKVKVTIMLYPSDRAAVIGKYNSVQKFINDMVSKVK